MNRVFFVLIIIAVLIIVTGLTAKKNQEKISEIPLSIGNKTTLNVSVLKNSFDRAKGYSGHKPIGFLEGKLFVFEQPGRYAFWMKEMLFDLDMIYIKANQVVDIRENVPAPLNNRGRTEVVVALKPFDKLLEVRSGFSEKFGIVVGDQVTY